MWQQQRRSSSRRLLRVSGSACLLSICHSFTASNTNRRFPSSCYHQSSHQNQQRIHQQRTRPLHVFAPPGSGYMRTDESDDVDPNDPYYLTKEEIQQISPSAFPDTYEPMLEYPGTMRPGRTPENMPYHDLPGLGMNDPNPVPWPHFQEIEWHHLWDPPHEQALAMEEFIEVEGRWASVEEEAEMRMGMRRGVRERREMEEMSKIGGAGGGDQMVIMDDDDDDESIMIGLGQGVESLLKSPAAANKKSNTKADFDFDEEDDDEEDDDDDGDFMLDLGLGEESPKKKSATMNATANDDDDDDEVEEDDDIDIDLDGMLGFDDDNDGDEDLDNEDGDFDDMDDDDDDMTMDDYNSKEDDDIDVYDDIDDY